MIDIYGVNDNTCLLSVNTGGEKCDPGWYRAEERESFRAALDFAVDLRLWFAEKISLHKLATQSLKPLKLLFGLNALSYDAHIKAFSHTSNQLHNIKRIFLRRYRIDKRFIDLDFIKIQFAESGERRIARAKIINGDSYAQCAEFFRIAMGLFLSLKRDDSVTSNSRRLAGSPVSARTDCTVLINDLLPN